VAFYLKTPGIAGMASPAWATLFLLEDHYGADVGYADYSGEG
jgi:hypothetical protein